MRPARLGRDSALPCEAAGLLRHRGAALLLADVVAFDGTSLVCTARGDGPWRWAQLLEAGAQAAGLLAGLQAGGPDAAAVIAELRDVVLAVASFSGPVVVHAVLERRVLGFWRSRVEVRADDGRVLCTGRIAVAPDPGPRP